MAHKDVTHALIHTARCMHTPPTQTRKQACCTTSSYIYLDLVLLTNFEHKINFSFIYRFGRTGLQSETRNVSFLCSSLKKSPSKDTAGSLSWCVHLGQRTAALHEGCLNIECVDLFVDNQETKFCLRDEFGVRRGPDSQLLNFLVIDSDLLKLSFIYWRQTYQTSHPVSGINHSSGVQTPLTATGHDDLGIRPAMCSHLVTETAAQHTAWPGDAGQIRWQA